MFFSRVVKVPSGISASARFTYGLTQPARVAQSNAASARRRGPAPRLLVGLIDVALLCDVRFPLAPQAVEVEPAIPPQRAALFLLVGDLGLRCEQVADHARRIRLVAGLDLLSEHGAADYTRSRRSGESLRALLTRVPTGRSSNGSPVQGASSAEGLGEDSHSS